MDTSEELAAAWSRMAELVNGHPQAEVVVSETKLVGLSDGRVTMRFPAGREWLRDAAVEVQDLIEAALTLTIGQRCTAEFLVEPPPVLKKPHRGKPAAKPPEGQDEWTIPTVAAPHGAPSAVDQAIGRFTSLRLVLTRDAQSLKRNRVLWLAELWRQEDTSRARGEAVLVGVRHGLDLDWETARHLYFWLAGWPEDAASALTDHAFATFSAGDLSEDAVARLSRPWTTAHDTPAAAVPRIADPALCDHGAEPNRCRHQACPNHPVDSLPEDDWRFRFQP